MKDVQVQTLPYPDQTWMRRFSFFFFTIRSVNDCFVQGRERLIHANLLATDVLQYNYNISKEVIRLSILSPKSAEDLRAIANDVKDGKPVSKTDRAELTTARNQAGPLQRELDGIVGSG